MISRNSSLRRTVAAPALLALRGATLSMTLLGVLMLQGDVRAGPGQGRDTRPTRTIRAQGLKVSLEEMRRLEEKLAKDRSVGGPAALMSVPPEEEEPSEPSEPAPEPPGHGAAERPGAPASAGGLLPAAPPLIQSFPGMLDDHDTIPPDTHGAAGIAHLASVVNRRVAFFDKSTGEPVFGPISNPAFWGALGPMATEPVSIYDARVIFDQYSGRFIIVAVRRPGVYPWIFLAISNGAGPEMGFTLFAIDGDASTPDDAPDFVQVGVGPDHVYVTCIMIRKGTNDSTGTKLWVIDKPALLSGSLLASEFVTNDESMPRFGQPATAFGPTSVGYLIGTAGGAGPEGENLLRIERVSFPSGSPVVTELGFIQVAGNQRDGSPQDAPQAGCSERIETNSSYLINSVFRNGKIWTAHHVADPINDNVGRAEVAWYEFDPTLARPAPPFATPLQQGRVSHPGRWFYYPSIAVTDQECVALGFSGSDASLYPGAFYTVRKPTDPPGTMRPVNVLKAGESPYFKRLFITNPRNRWGDYSATVVDPVDGATFWTLQEYALPQTGEGCPSPDTGEWGTWWGHFPCETSCRDSSDCDDGNPCTTDRCSQGECANDHVADGGSCDDGVFCNGMETCRGGACGLPATTPTCDDANPCTADSCDAPSDQCIHTTADSETASGPDVQCNTADDNPSLFGSDGSCGTSDDEIGDGVCDATDNCRLAANPGQEDRDGDRLGDACDTCPAVFAPGNEDTDNDRIGDVCDFCTDTDRDGFGDPRFPHNTCPVDNCPLEFNPQQPDLDGDGNGDVCDPCTDADRDGFGDGDECRGLDNCPEVANSDQFDGDADSVGNACDPCTDRDGDGFGDSGLDVFGDPDLPQGTCPVDNCPLNDNPLQTDTDRDGIGDLCDPCTDSDGDGFGEISVPVPLACQPDNCSALPNPDQADGDADGIGDVCDVCSHDPRNDADGDGACDGTDNCPAANPDQRDVDADGFGDACDNCLSEANPDQADSNHDGSGDACQPTLVLSTIRQANGETVEVVAEATDPDNDPLSGTLEVLSMLTRPLALSDVLVTNDCGLGFLPDDVPGEGIGFANGSVGVPLLFDLDAWLGCGDDSIDYWMSPGSCNNPPGPFDTQFDLSQLSLPAAVCVRRYGSNVGGTDLSILSFDDSTLLASVIKFAPALRLPFEPGVPGSLDITSLQAGQTYRVVITVTDGTTMPATAGGTFVHQGESTLVVLGPNRPPRAVISGAAGVVECSAPSGGSVTLNASLSTDPDSTPETNDDIVSFLWVLDPGRPTEQILGDGTILSVTLSLGEHAIGLRVTDSAGATDGAETVIDVKDATPPVLTCPPAAMEECAGPEGTQVVLIAAASDACGGVTLTSSRTGGTDASGAYPLGSTAVTFTATDASGNVATCATSVTVRDTKPPSLMLTLDPVILWPPNHRLVTVSAEWQVSDVCDSSVRSVLAAANSSEPDDATGSGDGNTTGDIQDVSFGTPDARAFLRAECARDGPGRTYTLTYSAVDASGNATLALGIVTVPRDMAPATSAVKER